MDKSEMLRTMAELGYEQRAPSELVFIEDQKVCRNGICSTCGQHGLDYSPFCKWSHHLKRNLYRPFSVCPACGDAQEF